MKARSFYTILAGVAGLLLGVAAILFFWLSVQSPLGLLKAGQDKTPAGAMFVPRQAPAMVSLLVNPNQLESFRLALVPPGERRRARAEVAQLKQTLLANTGLTFEQDIQPWLGDELTLAITTLDVDRDPINGKQPGYLLAVATKDAEQSREFLQLFWQKRAIAGSDLVFEQYKGVKLIYGSGAEAVEAQKAKGKRQKVKANNGYASLLTSPSLASAVVGDRFVLFANYPKVLRDAVTNVQAPDLSLVNASFYTRALETLDQSRVGLSFINLPGLANWLSETANQPTGDAKLASPPAATPYQTMAIALRLDRQGLVADTALVGGDKEKMIAASLTQPVGAMQFIPGNSLVAASGTDLDRLWNGLSQDLNNYETVSKLVNQPLKDLQTRWQIDLPQDIFSWVKGEYALGLVPAPQATASSKSVPNTPDEWVFVAQRSPAEPATQAIDHLDSIAKQQGLSVGPLSLGTQTISAWTRLSTGTGKQKTAPLTLQAEVRGVHASVGNYEIFTPSIAMMDQILRSTEDTLTRRDRFQQAIAPLQEPNNGYLYLDWNEAQPLLEQRFPLLKVVELAGKPFLSHLRSLTVSSYGSQAGVQRGGVFVKLS